MHLWRHPSSLDCNVWCSFCSLSYSRICYTTVAFSFMTSSLFQKVPVETEYSEKGKSVKIREKKVKRKQSLPLTHCAVVSNTHISHDKTEWKNSWECEESFSPSPRKRTFRLDWNFLEQWWRHKKRKLHLCNIVDCRKASKKNTRHYSRDYSPHPKYDQRNKQHAILLK